MNSNILNTAVDIKISKETISYVVFGCFVIFLLYFLMRKIFLSNGK